LTTSGRFRLYLGWTAVALSALVACFWAFWGIIENFHEGWYHRSLALNLAMMLGQYLLPALTFTGAACVAIRWPLVGATIHLAAAGAAAWHFRGASSIVVHVSIAGPLALTGLAYAFGRPRPRRRAVAAVVGLPLSTILVCGAAPALRVAGRIDDGDRGARRIAGRDVDLIWAPEGPGWPRDGVSWDEALRRCRHLAPDGLTVSEAPVGIWRLPTVDEGVRSMLRHGRNSGGVWDASRRQASYEVTPDKESPLWDPHSKVIYWWTATEASESEAFIVVYDGKVWPRPKSARWGYLGFRAVRDPS
jgi:hypothetical protein